MSSSSVDSEMPHEVKNEFSIYADRNGSGPVPFERSVSRNPITYSTKEAAERRIAKLAIGRIRRFLAGKGSFEDALVVKEFVVEVDVLSDGSIADKEENHFGKDNW